LLAGALCAAAVPAVADEQADEFVKGLQARGLDELTLEYLERMQTSRLSGEEFRRRIPYYRGVSLLSLSRKSADSEERNRHLEEARGELARFAEANPASTEAAEAQIQLGGVLVELGRQSVAAAAALPPGTAYEAQRGTLRETARSWFTDAGGLFQRVAEIYDAALERAPPTADARGQGEPASDRRMLRAGASQAQYLAANAKLEIALTYPPDGDAQRQLLESAATELANVYERYASAFKLLLFAWFFDCVF
jgi:hypothetical protein